MINIFSTTTSTTTSTSTIGQLAVSAAFMRQFQGKDMWASCVSLIASVMEEKKEAISYKQMGCEADFPELCLQQRSEEDYCKYNPKHPWCKDPCYAVTK